MDVSAIAQQLTPQMVTPAAVRTADSDGDGRTGVAALNDGDAAARQAAQVVVARLAPAPAPAPVPAITPNKVDVQA